jgi:serine/threonine-protein kinase
MIGRIISDRYRLESRAGEGGIGAVYRARHLLIDRIVAIKILQPVRRGETHHRAWFLREARAANRINHANIVDIYDFGDTEDGLYYLVMEYLEGEPLSHVIARGPMTISRTADILEQTCAAMARAHDLGVVHRDLKSDNVFLTDRGGRQDFVKVFDFGLAQLAHDARLAPEGAVFGTPEYMSPEQARGEEATPSSDLYALGVLFFEMLTGRLPFVTNNRKELLKMHQEAKPPSPREVLSSVPVEAERIILRLLEKEQPKRYRDAHHLLEDIKAFQRHAPREVAWDPIPSVVQPRAGARVALTSGVAAWSLRAVMYARMVSRANPRVSTSPSIRRALDDLWRLCAAVARVEGEIASEVAKVEAYERRGRDLRAQLGRQIEELAGEESRVKRSIAEAQAQATTFRADADDASRALDDAWAEIARLEIGGNEAALRSAYEKAGAARARYLSRSFELARVEAQVARMSASCAAITGRILELRESLERQSDALDTGLTDVRRRMADRGRDRTQILRDLERSASALSSELQYLAECRELFDEMEFLVGPMVPAASAGPVEIAPASTTEDWANAPGTSPELEAITRAAGQHDPSRI